MAGQSDSRSRFASRSNKSALTVFVPAKSSSDFAVTNVSHVGRRVVDWPRCCRHGSPGPSSCLSAAHAGRRRRTPRRPRAPASICPRFPNRSRFDRERREPRRPAAVPGGPERGRRGHAGISGRCLRRAACSRGAVVAARTNQFRADARPSSTRSTDGACCGLRRPARGSAEFAAEVIPYDVRTTITQVSGHLDAATSSLFAAMESAGEQPDLSVALAEIFAGEVDFNTELQPGDEFHLLAQKAVRDGQFIGYGPILAAELLNDGRQLRAFRFQPPGGEAAYYDAEGRSLKRFFLRSPLKFDPQVSSGFSRSRLHPVLNIRRAHLGVDYRAPAGAPVVAVSNGTVTFAGWASGGGRTVRIRHASGYESGYLHLSAFGSGIRRGAHVLAGADHRARRLDRPRHWTTSSLRVEEGRCHCESARRAPEAPARRAGAAGSARRFQGRARQSDGAAAARRPNVTPSRVKSPGWLH